MVGSKVKMWKQDPSVQSIGIRTAYIHTKVENGPKDADIEILEMPPVVADSEGNFLFDPAENPKKFDSVHTFTVVRRVLTMYRRALNRNGVTQNFDWQWGPGRIGVHPHAGVDQNIHQHGMLIIDNGKQFSDIRKVLGDEGKFKKECIIARLTSTSLATLAALQ